MTWKNQFGFVAINAVKKPFVADGMNETGMTVGPLYLPGFAEYQSLNHDETASALNKLNLNAVILTTYLYFDGRQIGPRHRVSALQEICHRLCVRSCRRQFVCVCNKYGMETVMDAERTMAKKNGDWVVVHGIKFCTDGSLLLKLLLVNYPRYLNDTVYRRRYLCGISKSDRVSEV